jgi:hypothetical protein
VPQPSSRKDSQRRTPTRATTRLEGIWITGIVQ